MRRGGVPASPGRQPSTAARPRRPVSPRRPPTGPRGRSGHPTPPGSGGAVAAAPRSGRRALPASTMFLEASHLVRASAEPPPREPPTPTAKLSPGIPAQAGKAGASSVNRRRGRRGLRGRPLGGAAGGGDPALRPPRPARSEGGSPPHPGLCPCPRCSPRASGLPG